MPRAKTDEGSLMYELGMFNLMLTLTAKMTSQDLLIWKAHQSVVTKADPTKNVHDGYNDIDNQNQEQCKGRPVCHGLPNCLRQSISGKRALSIGLYRNRRALPSASKSLAAPATAIRAVQDKKLMRPMPANAPHGNQTLRNQSANSFHH
jgi:hypothetical protein